MFNLWLKSLHVKNVVSGYGKAIWIAIGHDKNKITDDENIILWLQLHFSTFHQSKNQGLSKKKGIKGLVNSIGWKIFIFNIYINFFKIYSERFLDLWLFLPSIFTIWLSLVTKGPHFVLHCDLNFGCLFPILDKFHSLQFFNNKKY